MESAAVPQTTQFLYTSHSSKSTFKTTILNGEEVQIREILFARGWKALRHYHNSDLFVYVISGEFEVDMEVGGLTNYTSWLALRMKNDKPGGCTGA